MRHRLSSASLHTSIPRFSNFTAFARLYPLSLHDALPISTDPGGHDPGQRGQPQRLGLGVAHDHQRRRTVVEGADRKSTRLNSSHVAISYAVFCLIKKNHKKVSGHVLVSNAS